MKKLTMRELSEKLIGVDDLRLCNGKWIARRTYFYRTLPLRDWVEDLRKQLSQEGLEMKYIDSGMVDKKFVGGAPPRKSSHLWVRFRLA